MEVLKCELLPSALYVSADFGFSLCFFVPLIMYFSFLYQLFKLEAFLMEADDLELCLQMS